MKRRPRSNSYNDRDYDYDDTPRRNDYEPQEPKSVQSKAASWFNATAIAVLAGIFVLGIGVGVAFSSAVPTNREALVSDVQVDQQAPNPDICIQNGASALSMSTRLYVSLRPFKVFVAQAAMEPACVLRRANWSVLEQRKLLTAEQSRECRQKMNTFAYVGDLNNKPMIDCVYQSDNAKNLFLNAGDASLGTGDQF